MAYVDVHTQSPYAAPDEFRGFFHANDFVFRTWNRLSSAEAIRYDNLIGRIIGRHPQDIHPENWPLVMRVWNERWNVLQLWADPDEGMEPATPAQSEDLRAP